MIKKILFILVFLITVINVASLGLAPAKTNLDYHTNIQEGKVRIIVHNLPTRVTLETEDELGKYIELEHDVLTLTQSETWVNFKIKLPEKLPPGDRKGSILVSEQPDNIDQGNIVFAVPAIKHNVIVKVPYPGKYLTSKLFITNTEVEKPILFTIALANWGDKKIENAKAFIIIKGPTNEELAVLESKEISIDSKQEDKLMVNWQTENAGKYFVEVTVQYDDEILEISQPFNVGNLEIEIERIQVNNFKIGQIAKLDIYMRNKWNQQLEVEGRVEIFKDNNLISSFNALPIELKPKSLGYMEAYWNTENVNTGEYDILVKADYNGKTSERLFNSIVSIDNIQFKDVTAGQVIGQQGRNTTLLVIVVLILIVLNISLFIYINKRLKNR